MKMPADLQCWIAVDDFQSVRTTRLPQHQARSGQRAIAMGAFDREVRLLVQTQVVCGEYDCFSHALRS
jgi:hypothetical protein